MDPKFVRQMSEFHRASRIAEMARTLNAPPHPRDLGFDPDVAASAARHIEDMKGLHTDVARDIASLGKIDPGLHRAQLDRPSVPAPAQHRVVGPPPLERRRFEEAAAGFEQALPLVAGARLLAAPEPGEAAGTGEAGDGSCQHRLSSPAAGARAW